MVNFRNNKARTICEVAKAVRAARGRVARTESGYRLYKGAGQRRSDGSDSESVESPLRLETRKGSQVSKVAQSMKCVSHLVPKHTSIVPESDARPDRDTFAILKTANRGTVRRGQASARSWHPCAHHPRDSLLLLRTHADERGAALLKIFAVKIRTARRERDDSFSPFWGGISHSSL